MQIDRPFYRRCTQRPRHLPTIVPVWHPSGALWWRSTVIDQPHLSVWSAWYHCWDNVFEGYLVGPPPLLVRRPLAGLQRSKQLLRSCFAAACGRTLRTVAATSCTLTAILAAVRVAFWFQLLFGTTGASSALTLSVPRTGVRTFQVLEFDSPLGRPLGPSIQRVGRPSVSFRSLEPRPLLF